MCVYVRAGGVGERGKKVEDGCKKIGWVKWGGDREQEVQNKNKKKGLMIYRVIYIYIPYIHIIQPLVYH